jgi:hypothetical protein
MKGNYVGHDNYWDFGFYRMHKLFSYLKEGQSFLVASLVLEMMHKRAPEVPFK